MDGRSYCDVTNHNVWLGEQYGCCLVGLRLSALDTECEVLWFLLVGHTLLTLWSAFYLEDLLLARVIKEVVNWF